MPIVRREATRVVLVQDLHLEPVFFKTREQVLAREIAGCVGWTTRARALRRCHHTTNNIAAAAAVAAAGASIRIHTSYAVVDLLATQVAKDLFSSMSLVVLRVD